MTDEKFLRLNRTIGKHSRIFFLEHSHLMPLSMSVTFGIVVGQMCSLDFFWTVLWIIFPFATWMITVGNKPWKFRAKFDPVPRWTRGRVIADKALHKRKVGRINK